MARRYANTTEIKEVTAAQKSAMDEQYRIDHQIVKGVFKNFKQKNEPVRFVFRKYKEDSIEWYPKDINGKKQYFNDGKTYEIPLMVANHLNNDCYREVHQNGQDDMGRPLPETVVGSKLHRFGFMNTDFRPITGWKEPSPIVTVQTKLLH